LVRMSRKIDPTVGGAISASRVPRSAVLALWRRKGL